MKIPIKVLFVNGGLMDFGGVSMVMMNYFRHIDHNLYKIDFAVHGIGIGVWDSEIEAEGSHIYHLPIKSKHPFIYTKVLKDIILHGQYQVVHAHADTGNYWILKIAKNSGVSQRIAHSHNTDYTITDDTLIKKFRLFVNEYARKRVTHYSTCNLACSRKAGLWLFGKDDFITMNNAIEYERYAFNNSSRAYFRTVLGINGKFVIGHVGRFDSQKNHNFLINIFAEVKKEVPSTCLLLIGDGKLRPVIEAQAEALGIRESVVFAGARNDIGKIYSAMDLFVLPSLFEGLGLVLIEAQTSGLSCIVSDSVPPDANIFGSLQYLLLDNSSEWLNAIVSASKKCIRQKIDKEKLRQVGYDIEHECKKLEDIFAGKT